MWRDLFDLTRATGGPVHVHVAAAASGLTPATVRGRARREGWWQPYRDVVAPPGTPIDGPAWARAAMARLRGPDPDDPRPAGLARWTAAAVGLTNSWPSRVQVVVPTPRGPRADRRLEVVRSRRFETLRFEDVDGLPVLAGPALVRDLAAVADVPALRNAVIDLVQQRRTTLDDIAAEHDDRSHYPGRDRVEEVLTDLAAAGRTDSPPEFRMRRWLVGAGIPLDHGQVEVRCADGVPVHFDLGIASIFLLLDLTSMRAHSHRVHLRADAKRTNHLATAEGPWRVMQATVEDIGDLDFLATVRQVVAARSQEHLGLPWPPTSDTR